jgi:hypothetical protein
LTEGEIMDVSLREEMTQLSESLALKLGCSRLEAATKALRWMTQGLEEWPGFMQSVLPTSPHDDPYPEAPTVLRVAQDLGDYGFTLDDLIAAVGPEMVVRPKAYKNQLSRLLRDNGFFRKQIRRGGERPLAWFHPSRCGMITD